jgi:hypothetical protein
MPMTTSLTLDARTVATRLPPAICSDHQADFRWATTDKDPIPGPPTKVPVRTNGRPIILGLQTTLARLVEQVSAGMQSTAAIVTKRMMLPPYDMDAI